MKIVLIFSSYKFLFILIKFKERIFNRINLEILVEPWPSPLNKIVLVYFRVKTFKLFENQGVHKAGGHVRVQLGPC